MRTFRLWSLAFVAGAVLVLGNSVKAADPVPTTITIDDIHCAGCAKQVTAKLSAVPGVAKVHTDVKTKTAFVVPKPQSVLSPLALWDAVEKAGKQPTKLQGPNGTFTARPRS